MKNTIKQLKEDFNNIELMRLFEIEVINKDTKEGDWILFNIMLQKNTLVAQHVALTRKEETSKKIANKRVVLDSCFDIDMHLQALHEICTESIIDSDFFTLKD